MKQSRAKIRRLAHRLVAFFVALSLMLSAVFESPLTCVYAQMAEPLGITASFFPDVAQITLPEKLGTIQEVFRGPSSEAILLVQDAHTLYEAQKSIQGIIDYFQKKYGFGLIALEGGSGKVDPLLFRTYPNPEELQRIFDGYLKRGEISGALSAAVLNENEAYYYGVEDQALYEQGIQAFLEAEKVKPKLLRRIENFQKKLDLQKKHLYPKKLLDLDQAISNFEERKTDLVAFLRKLKKAKKGDGSILLDRKIEPSPFLFPHLNVLMREMAERFEPDQEKVKKEISQLIETLKLLPKSKEENMHFNERQQAYQTGVIEANEFGHFLIGLALNKNIAASSFPELRRKTAAYPLLREMQPSVLFKELESYIRQMKSSFLRDPRVRRLDQLNTDLGFLRRLVQLELTREDWDKFRIHRGIVRAYGGPKAFRDFEPHLRFYAIAVERDKALFENLRRLMMQSNVGAAPRGRLLVEGQARGPAPTILIAGGFHTQGLTRAFKQANVSYVLISPRITQVPEENRYFQMIQGDVSWKHYFHLHNGKINLYDAFAQATVDRLLLGQETRGRGQDLSFPLSPVSFPLRKAWRDEIIRTLARQNKIEKTGEYTRFTDKAHAKDVFPGGSEPLAEEFFFRTFQQATSMPLVNVASGIPSFETLPESVGFRTAVFARSEVREEIPLPKDLKAGVEEIVNAMLAEDFQGVIGKVERFIKSNEGEIHQLTDLRMKRSLLDWSETTREIAEQIWNIRSLAEENNGLGAEAEGPLRNGEPLFEEPRQGMIIPFSLVDDEMNQRIGFARKHQGQFVGIIPPLYDLGDWPYYLIAKEKATVESVIELFAANKNKNINDAFRMTLGDLLGYTEEETARFFGHVRYPKNRITPVEVRHFWKEPKLGYLKYLVGQYKDVLGIGGEIQRLMGFRALKSESSFYEVAGELFSAEMIRSALGEDYQVEILAFGFFIGFREFDAAIRITARNPAAKNRLPFEEGLYFIEAKHDDASQSALENLIQETVYGQVIAQMESLESLMKLGAPVKGIIVAVGGKKSRKQPISSKDLKRETISEDKLYAAPSKNRPRELLPVYSLILPSYDVENDVYPESTEAFVPDAETVKRWSRQPLDMLSLLKSQLFGNVWPPVNQVEIDALTELRRRQRERFIMMKKNIGEQKRRILAQAKDEEKRENEVIAWTNLFQKAGVQDPLLEPTLAQYFGKKNRSLSRLRLELFQKWWRHTEPRKSKLSVRNPDPSEGEPGEVSEATLTTVAQDPEEAWEWLKEHSNGVRKNGASKTVASQTVTRRLPVLRQSSSKLPGWEQDEDIEMRIQLEVSGLRDSSGWVVSFAQRNDVVSETGNALSQAEVLAALKEYFNQVKNQLVAERQKFFSGLRSRLQQSIQTAGRQQTWNLLHTRQWDQLSGMVAARSEIRMLSLVRKNPVLFFQHLHRIRGRRERVPQIEKSLSFAIHAPLIPDEKKERQQMINKILGREGYLLLPFENISASRQKSKKDRFSSEIYASRQPELLARFRPVAFVGSLNYSALKRKIRRTVGQKDLVTLMADGSLRIPTEMKGKILVFLVEPEILAILRLSELISIIQVIGNASDNLRQFYLEVLGLNLNGKTGVSTFGKAFINELSSIAAEVQSVKISA